MNISILFTICIIVRILIIYLAYLSLNYSFYYVFSLFYLILGIGLFYHYITKIRKKGGFNQEIWWDFLRPIHGIFFIISSYYIYIKNKQFIYILLIDTLLSIMGHIYYHYII